MNLIDGPRLPYSAGVVSIATGPLGTTARVVESTAGAVGTTPRVVGIAARPLGTIAGVVGSTAGAVGTTPGWSTLLLKRSALLLKCSAPPL